MFQIIRRLFRRKRSTGYWFEWYTGRLGSVAQNTQYARHATFYSLDKWLDGRNLLKVTPFDLPDFEKFLRQSRKASTTHIYFVVVKHFFTLAVRYKQLKRSPFEGYKMPPKAKTQHRQFDYRETVPRLLAACNDDKERLIISLGCMTGLRCAELANLTWGSVLLDEGKLFFTGKGNKDREVIISNELVEILRHNHNGSRFVISGFKTESGGVSSNWLYQVVKKIAKRGGFPGLTTHDLRRIYAGEFLRLGNDPACLQEQLGHSDISTTLSCYTVPSKKKKQDIVDQFELGT